MDDGLQILSVPSNAAPTVPFINPMASGQYYGPVTLAASGNISVVLNTAYYMPMLIGKACTVDRIRVNASVAGASANVIRLGIYADNGGKPGNLLVDGGTIDATGTGIKSVTISQALSAGLVWLATCSQVGTAGSVTGTNNGLVVGLPAATASVAASFCYAETGITGAFANVVTLTTSTLQPITNLRAV